MDKFTFIFIISTNNNADNEREVIRENNSMKTI